MTRPAISKNRVILIYIVVGAFSLGGYLLASRFYFRIGFPLDDAWIHQTYARNLVSSGEWSFIPGHPSAGSTAPLWSALLAIGYALGSGPYLWTFLLGWACLSVMGVFGYMGFHEICTSRASWGLWGGLLLITEWHLVWGAGSGMETLAFAMFVLIIFVFIMKIEKRFTSEKIDQTNFIPTIKGWFGLGILVGLSVWLRPDGVTLLGPVALIIIFLDLDWKEKLKVLLTVLSGFLLLFLPYLTFNKLLAGDWWPNTFYAKQAEYVSLRSSSLPERFLREFSLPLVGVGVILLPGFIYFLIHGVKSRSWGVITGYLWILGFVGMYAWRLPVVYQHGRYLIPVMPLFFLLGLVGLAELARPDATVLWQRVLSRSWIITLGAVACIFWGIGARAYAIDVAVIESEMVTTAQWISNNIEPDALIAAHDIGAIGYFSKHDLLDLAGLVSPQVIPFIRDEGELREFLDDNGADYLVTFPGWYPDLVRRSPLVFSSGGIYSPSLDGENMAVYRWNHQK